uniref:Uncharacterized protein n=1 Tax=Moniliophthora roreri TaxID=221103 RepID=A0A0W0GA01_MONRR
MADDAGIANVTSEIMVLTAHSTT